MSFVAVVIAMAATNAAVVDQPRPFGYVVGDLVTQRVQLADFEPTALPPAQRSSIWFERRTPRIEKSSDGRRWLVVDYQLINSPQALTTVHLPAWSIDGKGGKQLAVAATTISVAPLISDLASADIRPDRDVRIVDTSSARTNVFVWSIALAITLATWLGWLQWRNWRDRHNRPFARAVHELRRLDEMTPEAWKVVHHALDQTAGRVLQIETLPVLFERAPHLQLQRAEIERFFAQSNERFFGAGLQTNLLSVRTLCHELRRIERRHTQ